MCEGEPDYGVYLTRLDGNLVSPWHDVPTFCTHNSCTFLAAFFFFARAAGFPS